MNPYLLRAQKRGQTGHGRDSEKRVAKALGARPTPASGALKGHKGDLRKEAGKTKFLIEAKSTRNNTIPMELGWLVKIATEALAHKSIPALSLTFVTHDGAPRPMGDWVAVPATYFAELLEKVEGLDGSP